MADVWVAWLAFAVLAASPGPSIMAIMGTSLAYGRMAGMRFAAGVVTGSVIWGGLSALGTAALLSQAAWMLTGLKIAGGGYFLWLAYKAGHAAYRNTPVQEGTVNPQRQRITRSSFWPGVRRSRSSSTLAMLSCFPTSKLWVDTAKLSAGLTEHLRFYSPLRGYDY